MGGTAVFVVFGALAGAMVFAHGTDTGRRMIRGVHGRMRAHQESPAADSSCATPRAADTTIKRLGPVTVRVVRDSAQPRGTGCPDSGKVANAR